MFEDAVNKRISLLHWKAIFGMLWYSILNIQTLNRNYHGVKIGPLLRPARW